MRVLLYTKADCHLCDAFHFELVDLQSELGFDYEKCNLSEGDALLVEWEGHLPVIKIVGSDRTAPMYLMAPTSQHRLRAQIRQSATLSALAGAN